MDSTSGTSLTTKPTTPFECQQQERSSEHSTHLPPVSRGRWKKVQGGVFIPPARHRHTHAHTHTQMSNSSDSRRFVYTRGLARIKRSDEATLCWWMFFSHLLNRPTSVFMESQKPSGRKRARVADRQGRGGRVESRVEMREEGWRRRKDRGAELEEMISSAIEMLEEPTGSVTLMGGNPSLFSFCP